MFSLPIGPGLREVLVFGAHCDDVEIGCGGTLAALSDQHPDVRVNVVLFSGGVARGGESHAAIRQLVTRMASDSLEVHDVRDGYFPSNWVDVKELMEKVRKRVEPDIIFTHYEKDRHQDHRTICELTWNTFRNHAILEYEIPKYDGDVGQPNLYVPLTAEVVRRKVDTLLSCFPSQAKKRWFTEDLFRGFMRLRGMECNAESGYAEAFHVRKLVAGL